MINNEKNIFICIGVVELNFFYYITTGFDKKSDFKRNRKIHNGIKTKNEQIMRRENLINITIKRHEVKEKIKNVQLVNLILKRIQRVVNII